MKKTMVQLSSTDVVLSIATFLTEKKDLWSLSLVNRVFYPSLPPRRARHLRVVPGDLPSLALFLLRNDAFRCCRSFEIIDAGPSTINIYRNRSVLDRKRDEALEAFSETLILWVLGGCGGDGLQFLEGGTAELPRVLWHIMKSQGDCIIPLQEL